MSRSELLDRIAAKVSEMDERKLDIVSAALDLAERLTEIKAAGGEGDGAKKDQHKTTHR